MISLWSFLSLVHLVGLALGVGSATVKLTLLFKCTSDYAFVPVYIKVAKPITRLIILGLILLTLSGIGWIPLGSSFTLILGVKHAFVVLLWVLGPLIDNVVEPKFKKLAPVPGEPVAPEFAQIQKQYLTLEVIATVLFYVITVMGVLVPPTTA